MLQLFNPERLPGIRDVPGLTEYFKGLGESYAQYLLPSFESADDLKPGQGAVVQKVRFTVSWLTTMQQGWGISRWCIGTLNPKP